ncbi:phosphopantothenoylcysteine decarboxylase [Erysipelotrichaceae bacterium]|nr:phosphopantothenoylcysteine decarboxylase [Erysipelotrichaceae bacterium]
MAKITLGVTGSIAVTKIAHLIKCLQDLNHEIYVIMTKNAMVFDENAAIATLVGSDHFYTYEITMEKNAVITHIALAQEVDLLAIIPATYNSINKFALGIADDLLGSVFAAADVPILIAPAMNTHMYNKPIVRLHLAQLRSAGVHIIEPEYGLLACGVTGIGRLANNDVLIQKILELLPTKKQLLGKKVVISAGPTRVYIDPIRYITNTSTGKMGIALAEAALSAGADVCLVLGPTTQTVSSKIRVIAVETPEQMATALFNEYIACDYLFMAAAVSDYRPLHFSPTKIKKQADIFDLKLTASQDILLELGKRKKGQCLVGFAAEDSDHLKNATRKLISKNLDFILINDLENFKKDTNTLTLLDVNGNSQEFPQLQKMLVAPLILNHIIKKRVGK